MLAYHFTRCTTMNSHSRTPLFFGPSDGLFRKATAQRTKFAPFSASRACVGKNLAYLELMVTMGTLLYRIDVSISEDGGGEVLGLMWGRRNKGQFQHVYCQGGWACCTNRV